MLVIYVFVHAKIEVLALLAPCTTLYFIQIVGNLCNVLRNSSIEMMNTV